MLFGGWLDMIVALLCWEIIHTSLSFNHDIQPWSLDSMWFEGGLYMVVALLPWKYIYIPILFSTT